MPIDDSIEVVDRVFVGSSVAPHLKKDHMHARSDAPLSARGMDDSEFLADRRLGLFMGNILLRENLKPLQAFVQNHEGYSFVDTYEYETLGQLLHSPIRGGVMHEIQQWRFTDFPTFLLFKEWRTDRFPEYRNSPVFTYYDRIYQEMREREHYEGGGISFDLLTDFCNAAEELYQFIEDNLDPHLKRIWVENEIQIYEKWEGKTSGLPGRLTPEYVDERLQLYRSWRDKFRKSAEGIIEYRQKPSINYN